MRSIDILKNLSQADAELFEKICSNSISIGDHIFVPNYDEYLNKYSINYSEIMRLDELGLINSGGLIALTMNITQERRIVFSNGSLVILIKPKDDNSVKFNVKQFPLTDAGRELISVQNVHVSDSCYRAFAVAISQNEQIAVELHQVITIQGSHIEYNHQNLLEEEE